MTIPDDIKNKLLKLFALEEGARKIGSFHEAENAAAKAQEILIKYNLERSDLKEAPLYQIEKVALIKYYRKNEGSWIVTLFAAIARYNMCELLTQSYGRDKRCSYILILGLTENIEIVKYVVDQLVPVFRSLARQNWANYFGPEKRNAYIRGFLKGGCWGVESKLFDEWSRMQNKDRNVEGLILHNKAKLNNFIKEQFPKVKSSKSKSLSGVDGQVDGYQTGKNLNIKKGINGNMNSLNQKMIK